MMDVANLSNKPCNNGDGTNIVISIELNGCNLICKKWIWCMAVEVFKRVGSSFILVTFEDWVTL